MRYTKQCLHYSANPDLLVLTGLGVQVNGGKVGGKRREKGIKVRNTEKEEDWVRKSARALPRGWLDMSTNFFETLFLRLMHIWWVFTTGTAVEGTVAFQAQQVSLKNKYEERRKSASFVDRFSSSGCKVPCLWSEAVPWIPLRAPPPVKPTS